MYCTRSITDQIVWVGGEDHRLALFENLFPIQQGVSYNSYCILDEKTAVIDTVDQAVGTQFIENVLHTLNGRTLDYLVVNHMEPDHCSNIEALVLRFPEIKIVGNMMIFKFMKQFYDFDVDAHSVLVKEGDSLSLGEHTLQFYTAPNVHWPEVMMTYEVKEGILFSADAFGTFGACNGNLFADQVDFDRDYLDDARRYYSNIVGKFGVQVQAALKKAASLDVKMICPLHGPIWRENLAYFIEKYDLWSRYVPEEQAVIILYGSMYGNTENAMRVLANELSIAGVRNIKLYDVSSTDISVLISEIFRVSHIVLAAPTYNAGIYPKMANLLHDMKALNVQNRTIGVVDNGTWAAMCAKQISAQVQELKNITLLEPVVSIKSALKEDALEGIVALKDAIVASL
ncbi:MAG: FprA family A-type flavoprotein [Lachnospiraceae bacterium]